MKIKRILLLTLIALVILGLSIATSQDDPFAGLGGGEEDGLTVPDGASSIRAKRKASKNQFEGIVVKVVRKSVEFPMVDKVKVKLTKVPKSKKPKKVKKGKKGKKGKKNKKGLNMSLETGKIYEFTFTYTMKDGAIDLTDKNNQTNIGAYFMRKGDKVVGVVKEKVSKKRKKYELKYLERK